MQEIPQVAFELIVQLRKENGLDPAEAAIRKDLAKAKWLLEPAPRYRKAGRSPIFISGKYLSSTGKDPVTGEADGQSGPVESPAAPAPSSKLDETAFYKVLHGKGFGVRLTKNLLTDEVEHELPAAIAQLKLTFREIPERASGVHVIQTSPQIQVAMSLDTFLDLAGIKP